MATRSTHVDSSLAPLCVHLEGALLRSDVLLESVLQFLRQQPGSMWRLLAGIAKGVPWLKHYVAQATSIQPELLPYHPEVLEWLREERARGRRLILVTSSDELPAREIAEHLGLFDEVIASDLPHRALLDKLQQQGYDYAGKAHVDRSFPAPSRSTAYLRMLRPHQWFKNVLLFIPLIVSHKLLHGELEVRCLAMFLAFCATASGLYIWNDLLDLRSDRVHPTKRTRPLASGAVPLAHGILISLGLLALGAIGGALLGGLPSAILALYALTSFLYSIRLKRVLLVDVFTLAFLYMIRVVGGGAVTGIVPSEWLLAFTLFWFLSLALAKRVAELHNLARGAGGFAPGRGYRVEDREQLNIFGIASGFLSSMVLAFYITTENVRLLYLHPSVLWLLWPILLFWLLRIWLMVHRGELDEDPVVFAVHDRTSYVLGGLCVVVMLAANSGIVRYFRIGN